MRLLLALCLSLSSLVFAQVPLDQVDRALGIARLAATNEATIKDARIAALTEENLRLKAQVASCESKEK